MQILVPLILAIAAVACATLIYGVVDGLIHAISILAR